jgi:hypothetical protein
MANARKRWRFDLHYLVRWFRDGQVFWISILIAFAIGSGMLFLPKSVWPFTPGVTLSDRIRYAGLLYEFLGVLIVAIVVYRARQALGAEPLHWVWIGYFKRFVRVVYSSDQVSTTITSSQGMGLEFGANVTVAPITGTIYERLNRLETAFRDVRTELDKVRNDFNEKILKVDQRVTKEGDARVAGDKENQRLFTTSVIGDSGWEFAGVAFLWLGILCWGLPDELAKHLFDG